MIPPDDDSNVLHLPAGSPASVARDLVARSAGNHAVARRHLLLFLTTAVAEIDGLPTLLPSRTALDQLETVADRLYHAVSAANAPLASVASDIYDLRRIARFLSTAVRAAEGQVPTVPRPAEAYHWTVGRV